MPLHKRFYHLSSKVYRASKGNLSITLCLFGNLVIRLSVVLYSSFLLLWITSFVDNGVLKSEEEAKSAYQVISIVATCVSCLCQPFAGKFADLCPAHITIPFAYLFRGLAAAGLVWLDAPNTWLAYAVCVAVQIANMF
jgi:hypothetical protein